MSRPADNETVDEVHAALRRNHPELTDRDINRILSGPPPRRRPARKFIDNWGRRAAVLEAPSAGRVRSARPSLPLDDS